MHRRNKNLENGRKGIGVKRLDGFTFCPRRSWLENLFLSWLKIASFFSLISFQKLVSFSGFVLSGVWEESCMKLIMSQTGLDLIFITTFVRN